MSKISPTLTKANFTIAYSNQKYKNYFDTRINNTETKNDDRFITLANIYICTIFVLVGLIGNIISFFVFLKAGKKAPRIMTKNLLILLTLSNSIYLILFWYYSIFPKLINSFNIKAYTITNTTKSIEVYENSTIAVTQRSSFINQIFVNRYYFVNTNIVACKLISYLISVSIFLNSAITVSFSLERALAINFPLKIRNLRENYRYLFKLIMSIGIIVTFLFPVYNLFLTNLVAANGNGKVRCDIPSNYESLYFNFTIVFVIKTLAIPFVIITLSNISILIAIEKNKKNLLNKSFNRYKDEHSSGSLNSKYNFDSMSHSSMNHRNSNEHKRVVSIGNGVDESHPVKIHNSSKTVRFENLSAKSLSCKIGGGSGDKNLRVTKMLISISASFVLLNLPYFITWCRYALFRLNNSKPFTPEQTRTIVNLYDAIKITEILNLFNYAITSFLYFATGKIYRENLYSIFSFKKKHKSKKHIVLL
jgi:hypothetical protein